MGGERLERALTEAERSLPLWERRLAELIAIPSVSPDPEHAGDLQRAAEWLSDLALEEGLGAEQLRGEGAPLLLIEGGSGDHSALIYGHYDVQTPGPLSEWSSPPFQASERGGRLYGRGASDDKGGLLMPLAALSAWKRAGGCPLRVKVLLEGEEEVGSRHLGGQLRRHGARLAAEVALSSDGRMWSAWPPSLRLGSRGLLAFSLEVTTAAKNLHSGHYGGLATNALQVLIQLLAGLVDPLGRVRVPGFYDRVRPPEPDSIPFDEAQQAEIAGVPGWGGDPAFTPLQRLWWRPTLEVHSVGGSFDPVRLNTSVPSRATAQLSCRLVADQDPGEIAELLAAWVAQNSPALATVRLETRGEGEWPYSVPSHHPAARAAKKVLGELYGTEPLLVRSGGTVPAASLIGRELGLPLIYFAFGEMDNALHAPDEFLRLDSFRMGVLGYVRLLAELASALPGSGAEGG